MNIIGFFNRRPHGRRENYHGDQGFDDSKAEFLKFHTFDPEDYFQREHEAKYIFHTNNFTVEKMVTISLTHFKSYEQSWWDKVCSRRRETPRGLSGKTACVWNVGKQKAWNQEENNQNIWWRKVWKRRMREKKQIVLDIEIKMREQQECALTNSCGKTFLDFETEHSWTFW